MLNDGNSLGWTLLRLGGYLVLAIACVIFLAGDLASDPVIQRAIESATPFGLMVVAFLAGLILYAAAADLRGPAPSERSSALVTAGVAAFGCGIMFVSVPPSRLLGAVTLSGVSFFLLEKLYARPSRPESAGLVRLDLTVRSNAITEPSRPPQPRTNASGRRIASSIFKGMKETTVGIAAALAVLATVNYTVGNLDPDQLDLRPLEASVLHA